LPSAAAERRLAAVLLSAVVVVGTVLRLRDSGSRSLWVDELFSVAFASQSLGTMLRVMAGEEANMALYYLAMRAWVPLVGYDASEVWMRLPSIVFGVASLPAIFALGVMYSGRTAGLLAASLLAINPYHVGMSLEARAYSMWSLAVISSWIALEVGLRSRRWRAWPIHGATLAVAFGCHLFTVFPALAQGSWALCGPRSRTVVGLALAATTTFALASPLLWFAATNASASQIAHVLPSDASDLFELFREWAGGSPLVLIGYALLTAGALVVGHRSRQPGDRLLPALLWLLVPILLLFVLSYVKPLFKDRYLFASMPALTMVVAIAFARLVPRSVRIPAAGAVVAIVISLSPWNIDVRQSENWRGAIAYLESSVEPQDGLIFISKRGQLGWEYYAKRLGQQATMRPEILEPFDWDELAERSFQGQFTTYRGLTGGTDELAAFASRHPRIWVVLSHEFDALHGGDTSATTRDWLTRRGYAARQRTFQGIRVLLYERRA
jgi:mannosyltransferase